MTLRKLTYMLSVVFWVLDNFLGPLEVSVAISQNPLFYTKMLLKPIMGVSNPKNHLMLTFVPIELDWCVVRSSR